MDKRIDVSDRLAAMEGRIRELKARNQPRTTDHRQGLPTRSWVKDYRSPHTDTHRIGLGTKNIAISEEAYQRLKALKRPGESFTEVIERVTRSRGILDLTGVLSKEQGRAVSEEVREMRERGSHRLQRTIERLS